VVSLARRLEALARKASVRPRVQTPTVEVTTVINMVPDERDQAMHVHFRLSKMGLLGQRLDEAPDGRLVLADSALVIAETGEWEAWRRFPPEVGRDWMLFRREPRGPTAEPGPSRRGQLPNVRTLLTGKRPTD
jgi:hypothetical protein